MAIQEKYEEATIILKEGSNREQMFMVISGTVGLYVNYGKPNEYLLGLCNKGTIFGEMCILCHTPSMYTAVAETDTVTANFSEHELDFFIKSYPDRAIGIMRSISRMNNILSVNLKMVLTESQKEPAFLDILSDALNNIYSNSDSINEENELRGHWHYIGKK